MPVTLTDSTRYLKVAPPGLHHVDPGAYIGTVTKSIRNKGFGKALRIKQRRLHTIVKA
jgi:hypothetical protein